VSFLSSFFKNLRHRFKNLSRTAELRRISKKQNLHDQRLVQFLAKKQRQKTPQVSQLKYFKKVLNPTERLIVKIAGFLIFFSAIALLVNLYFQFSSIVPANGGEYTEGLLGYPKYINPILSQNNEVDADICSLIFSGLFKYDTEKGIIGDLVDNYEVNADQKTYTFYLKQDVLWHDGQKLTSDDVLYTIEKIKDPNSKSPMYFGISNIKAEKINDYSFKLTLSEPYAPFLESLMFGILPKHIWQTIPAQEFFTSKYNLEPIGSGPFKFSGVGKDQNNIATNFSMTAFKNYFGKAPYLSTLHFKFYSSFDQAVDALNNKNVEGLSYLPKSAESKVANHSSLNFYQLRLPQYTALFFNAQQKPLLGYPKIRQLLAQAVDRNKIVSNILNDEAEIIDGPFLTSRFNIATPTKTYQYNPSYVKTQLDGMGWKLAEYKSKTEQYPFQVRKKSDQYMEFTVTTINQPENAAIAEFIKTTWQPLGIKVNLEILNPTDLAEKIKNRDYEILLYGEILSYDPDPYPFWHSSQTKYPGLNLALYQNATADKLLEDARKTADQQTRVAKYNAFQQILINDAPAVFLFSPTYTYPQSKIINGFHSTNITLPSNRFSDVTEWYINVKRKL
jgi:peptide/nickel transport system substrate-binding protein